MYDEECVWNEDINGNWITGCGRVWSFSNLESPKENGVKFCPTGGKPVVISPEDRTAQ